MRYEFQYQQEFRDYLEALKVQSARFRSRPEQVLSWITLCLPVLAFLYLALSGLLSEGIEIVLIVCGIYVGLQIYLYYSRRLRNLRHYQTFFNSERPKLMKIEIDDDAMQIETSNSKTTYTWKAFAEVKETEEYLLLFLHRGSVLSIRKGEIPSTNLSRLSSELKQKMRTT